jgi:hypothetical protein
MPTLLRRMTVMLTCAGSVIALGLIGALGDAAASQERSALPRTTAEAQSIVTQLWQQREAALTSLDSGALPTADGGALLELDTQYVGSVRCGCLPAKDAHPVESIVIDAPPSSVQPVFFAELKTHNATNGTYPWYLVAVAKHAGDWRIVFLTLGSYGHRPAMPLAAESAVTTATHRRMSQLAQLEARAASSLGAKPTTSSWGGISTFRAKVDEAKDGVYGVAFRSGQVLSCYTLHVLETTRPATGRTLVQTTSRQQWGQTIAPGEYRSVTVDSGLPECVLGTGAGTNAGKVMFQYTATAVGVTAVPA